MGRDETPPNGASGPSGGLKLGQLSVIAQSCANISPSGVHEVLPDSSASPSGGLLAVTSFILSPEKAEAWENRRHRIQAWALRRA